MNANSKINVIPKADWQDISVDVMREKSAKNEEKNLPPDEMVFAIQSRVAKGLSEAEVSPEKFEKAFLRALESGFIPAGRILSGCGTDIKDTVTLLNCFVLAVGDSISETVDNKPGIYTALQQSAECQRRGGGVGYNFSSIRPKNALVKGTGSRSSGPVSYMKVFDTSAETVESAGYRRGAQMAILNIDHPDILEFIHAKHEKKVLNNFNLSIGIFDDFMDAVESDSEYELVHKATPSNELIDAGAFQRKDGLWVYSTVKARELWDIVMLSTYDYAEPGVLFLGKVNQHNNLWYCEYIDATNPCGEQPLYDKSSCCLGSLNLAMFISNPFTEQAHFDLDKYAQTITTCVRMLDNVLDVSTFPLPEQKQEALNKRRIGLGFTALGNALILLGIKYDSEEGRQFAKEISIILRDTAYRASVELAKEKGAFPLFEKAFLESGMAKDLPKDIREDIRKHGIRNSHLLSIAPTGTISLSFGKNVSNGIEPSFSWFYDRTKREEDGTEKIHRVEDYAFRLYRQMGGDTNNLPDYFRCALDISVQDHMQMQAVIQPYICASISKTVNVPENYPYSEFKNLYFSAYKAGVKGMTTFRPNPNLSGIFTLPSEEQDLDQTDPDRKIIIPKTPEIALATLRWASRPMIAEGTPSITYVVDNERHKFAVIIGHMENGRNEPFEVWLQGDNLPRGMRALAKTLSMDMRSMDRKWLKMKLDSLIKTTTYPFEMTMPDGDKSMVSGSVSALAQLVKYRCEKLGAFEDDHVESPLVDAMFSRKEPKSGTDGTQSWTADMMNPTTGDDLAMFVKECRLADGISRPYSVWFAGSYPLELNGLAKSLSLDMRVMDIAWIAKKLRGLSTVADVRGDFFGRIPGSEKQEIQPSTVAYIAKLLIHRYNMLGLMDAKGYPIQELGMFLEKESGQSRKVSHKTLLGKICPVCETPALIKRDGCEVCTSCGHMGSCG